MKRPTFLLLVVALFAAFSLVTQVAAQVTYGDFTNSRVSYLQVTESGPVVFGAPTLSIVSPEAPLTFNPTNFVVEAAFSAPDLLTNSSTVQMTIKAAPGFWFAGDVLQIATSGSFDLVAPLIQSQASATFSGSYRLWVTEVDNNLFAAGPPLSANVLTTPPSVSISGPNGVLSQALAGSATIEINTIKAHFGIAPTSNVTGMLLEYTGTLVAGGSSGSARVSVGKLVVGSTTISTPTTNVILTVEKAANLSGQWQFDREINVGPMTNTNEFYRLKIRTVVE